MRWEDERYIRIFTRDTPTWDALGWEAQALLVLIFRKMDRTGLLALGSSGMRGLSACVRMPADVVERALAVLVEDGVLSWSGRDLFCKNFMAAQECAKSDALRSKEKRERAHARLCSNGSDTESGTSDTKRPEATRGDTTVPRSDTPSVPSVPNLPEETLSPRAIAGAGATEHQAQPSTKLGGHDLIRIFGRLRREVLKIEPPPGAGNPRDTTGKASTFADGLTDDEAKDVEATMRIAFERIRDGVTGWDDPRHTKDPSFAFGAWKSGFEGLRESVHGVAPVATAREHKRFEKPASGVDPNWREKCKTA
jgi:hypothetical protein